MAVGLVGALGSSVPEDPLTVARKSPDTTGLEDRVGHVFSQRALLTAALTHASALSGDDRRADTYQRLEFLGDRVLGLCVADMLFARFPDADEGELSRRLAALVRKETCADVALAWEAGPFIRLGPGEMRTGGRRKAAILGDICEAIIGAVYLDGGMDAARRVVAGGFGALLEGAEKAHIDAKTMLQEWSQAQGLGAPLYAVIDRNGPDHAPHFRIEVTVASILPEIGAGRSKRDAEHAAAQALLTREGVWTLRPALRPVQDSD